MAKLKKIITLVLVASLLLSPFQVFAAQEDGSVNRQETKSQARQAFELAVSDRYSAGDRLDVVVGLKENYYADLGRNYSGAELKNGRNYENQLEFSRLSTEKALAEIAQAGIDLEVLYRFDLLWFGFAANLTYQDALKLTDMDFVQSVAPATTYDRPQARIFSEDVKMLHSREIVGQDKVYGKYKGEGTVIAVIDSGFDVTHPAFYISDEYKDSVKLNQEQVEKLVKDKEIAAGRYVNDKIPFAYNYEKKNNEIKEQKVESHGQHVAGTSAGNVVNMEEGTFSGIAPEAQFLAMRVFPEDGGTQDFIYAKAMEDAVKLGADSMNLSLGSSAGSLRDVSDTLDAVITKASDMGIVIAIAAGNDSHYGESVANPKATEPDFGIMSTPAITQKSMAVASFNNTKIMQRFITLYRGQTTEEIGIVQPSDSELRFSEEAVELVYSKLGYPDDIPDEVKGKYALIERGAITFTEKINNAAAKGAIGAIIYNHEIGGNDFISMSAAGSKIPSCSIRRDVALRLLENLSEYKAKVNNHVKAFDSKTSGYISDFSNWGVTAEGDLKPEIMAPGGNIYSTIANNLYGNMSGTSMASPHVAGGIALVKSRVNKEFANLSGFEKYELIKNLMMSTATPHINLDTNTYSSPRNQGAGIMNLHGALTSDVIVYDKNTKNTKINLGNVEDKFTITATLKNLKDTPAKYRYKAYVATDQVIGDYITLDPRHLLVVEGEEITVAGGEEKEIQLSVDTSAFTEELTKKMPNGYFLDGFVIFENAGEENPQPNLSIPFLGFKGNFGALENLEPFVYELAEEGRLPRYYKYEKDGSFSARDFTHFFTIANGKVEILGQADNFNPARPQFYPLVLSPNEDENADAMAFTFTLLRNISQVKVNLFAADDTQFAASLGELLSFDGTLPKNYFSGDQRRRKSYSTSLEMDVINDPKVVDGSYKILVETLSLVPNAEPNRKVVDLLIDRKAPTAENIQFEEATRILTFTAGDEVSGVKKERVSFTEGDRRYYLKKEGEGYRIPEGISLMNVKIELEDYGFNKTEKILGTELLGENYGTLLVQTTVTPAAAEMPTFTERLVSSGNESQTWNKDKLPFGTYKLYIENIAAGYRLLGDNPVTFSVSKDNRTVTKELQFEKIATKRLTVQVPDDFEEITKVRAVNTATNQAYALPQLVFGPFKLPLFRAELPYGEYQVHFDISVKGKTLKLKDTDDNKVVIDDSYDRTKVWETVEAADTERTLTIHTKPDHLQVEYHVFNLASRALEESGKLGNGVYVVFPKQVPAGYKPDKPLERIVVDQNTTSVEVTFTYEEIPQGMAKVTVNGNHKDYDLTPEYLLVDVAAFLGLDGVKYVLSSNPEVPFGPYILTADKASYDESKHEMEEGFVDIDAETVELKAVWKEVNEMQSYLNVSVDVPEEIKQVNIEFFGSYKKPFALEYNKEDYKTHSVLLRHDIYNVVVKDLPEGYVAVPSPLTVNHKGNSILAFAIKKADSADNLIPSDPGFGRLLVEVLDEEGNPVTDVETKVYHNDAPVDWKQELPYGYYEARIENLDQSKYRILVGKKEVELNKQNRLIPISLSVEVIAVKTKLQEMLDKAKQVDYNEYTPESVNVLKEAIAFGQKVMDDPAARQRAVNEAVAKLDQALQGLTLKMLDTLPFQPGPGTSTPSVPANPGTPKPADKDKEEIKEQEVPKGETTFADVPRDAWFAEAVRFAKEKGLMQGTGNNEFKPNAEVTRGMVVTILYRLEKEPDTAKLANPFKDVTESAYYANAVKWASSQNIVRGVGDGTFLPEQAITREQLAHILANYAAFKNKKAEQTLKELTFADKDEISAFAVDSMLWAVQEAIFKGKDGNRISPKDTTTRAELAKVLQNFVEKVADKEK